MKRFLAIVLCAAFLITALPAMFASAADGTEVVAADDGSTGGSTVDVASIISSLTGIFGSLSEFVDWGAIGSAIWKVVSSAFSQVYNTIKFFFDDMYGRNTLTAALVY